MRLRKGSIVFLVVGLSISFPAPGATQTAGLTFDRYVMEPSDDAVEIVPSGLVTRVSQTIEMICLEGANQLVAIRFSSVPIPRGASILRPIYSTEGTQRTCYKTLGPGLHLVYSTGSGQAIPRVSKYEIYYGTLHNHPAHQYMWRSLIHPTKRVYL
jgi:hypothetical protein